MARRRPSSEASSTDSLLDWTAYGDQVESVSSSEAIPCEQSSITRGKSFRCPQDTVTPIEQQTHCLELAKLFFNLELESTELEDWLFGNNLDWAEIKDFCSLEKRSLSALANKLTRYNQVVQIAPSRVQSSKWTLDGAEAFLISENSENNYCGAVGLLISSPGSCGLLLTSNGQQQRYCLAQMQTEGHRSFIATANDLQYLRYANESDMLHSGDSSTEVYVLTPIEPAEETEMHELSFSRDRLLQSELRCLLLLETVKKLHNNTDHALRIVSSSSCDSELSFESTLGSLYPEEAPESTQRTSTSSGIIKEIQIVENQRARNDEASLRLAKEMEKEKELALKTKQEEEDASRRLVEEITKEDAKEVEEANERKKKQEEDDMALVVTMQPKFFECKICFDDQIPEEDIAIFSNCGHILCRDHFREQILNEIKNFKPTPQCHECRANICDADVQMAMTSPSEYEEYLQNRLVYMERMIAELVQCPKPDCKGMAFVDNIQKMTETEPTNDRAICDLCRHEFCPLCFLAAHPSISCHGQRNLMDESADQRAEAAVRASNGRRCPQCKFYVLKTDGCNHIRCRCGADFCYACGVLYVSGSHPGGCVSS